MLVGRARFVGSAEPVALLLSTGGSVGVLLGGGGSAGLLFGRASLGALLLGGWHGPGPAFVRLSQVEVLDLALSSRADHLDRSAVDLSERGSECLVPGSHAGECRGQCVAVQWAG